MVCAGRKGCRMEDGLCVRRRGWRMLCVNRRGWRMVCVGRREWTMEDYVCRQRRIGDGGWFVLGGEDGGWMILCIRRRG